MIKKSFLALLCIFCLVALPALAAQDSLVNIAPEQGSRGFAPGAVITLPDGRQTIIMEVLPNGDFATDLGINISPDGIIKSGEQSGQSVIIAPEFSAQQNVAIPAPETKIVVPETKTAIPDAKLPEKEEQKEKAALPGSSVAVPAPAINKEPEKKPQPAVVEQKNKKELAQPEKEETLTLAEMLPLTSIDPKKTEKPKEEQQVKQPKTEKKAQEKEAPKKQEAHEKPAQKKKEAVQKPEPEKQAAQQPPKQKKAAVGEEMRIPQEAIKSGKLDFLEGCWQGTRPEYFSKRTVKECFCFGAGGKSGKRRIYDVKGGRMCVGATRAHLSKSGVLSVTSEGAACNDGERWGSAEMVCRNSGPRTPCSWVFHDANNGRQAYTIPFVRVEQCGR